MITHIVLLSGRATLRYIWLLCNLKQLWDFVHGDNHSETVLKHKNRNFQRLRRSEQNRDQLTIRQICVCNLPDEDICCDDKIRQLPKTDLWSTYLCTFLLGCLHLSGGRSSLLTSDKCYFGCWKVFSLHNRVCIVGETQNRQSRWWDKGSEKICISWIRK